MTYSDRLDALLNPKRIAVIGASEEQLHVGGAVYHNLIHSAYSGEVYSVNPKYTQIGDHRCFSSLTEINVELDLVIIATPAKTVPGIVAEALQRNVKGITILSSGFSESGGEGNNLTQQILSLSKPAGIPIIGPNCLGFMRPSQSLNASFARITAQPGKIAFISQSGALCTAILDWANKNYVGFSAFISIGDMVDVGFHNLIDYFANDRETESIILYMESLTKARNFLSAARAASRIKPVIVLKSGKSLEGTRAAKSHTGSLAGNDRVFDAAFKRAGMLRVQTIGELFDAAETLDMQKLPYGNRLAIITNAGGPGVIATDALIEQNGHLAELAPRTIEILSEKLPPAWSHANPIDILGDADPERYTHAIKTCLADEQVDGIVIVLTPQAMTDPIAIAQAIATIRKTTDKVILASWMGEFNVDTGREILEQARIPVYRIPEHAVRCFMNMYRYKRNLTILQETPATIPHAFSPDKAAAKALIHTIAQTGRYALTEYETKHLLRTYEIPVVEGEVARSQDEAVAIADKIGYPVVLKISSADILHKTETGGKILNITSSVEVRRAYDKILSVVKETAPSARLDGVLVERMVKKTYELIIGCKKDSIFGPAIVFGMGGVAVDIFKDTTVGLPPLNMALASRLIEDTKISTLLKGYRNMPAADIKSIQFVLYAFAYLIMDIPEIQEIDINPFSVDEHGGIVLDAKVLLDPGISGNTIQPYSHLVISPYPAEYKNTFTAKNGMVISLRPIRPEDEPLEAEMFKTFSRETQRFRFFGYLKDVSHDMLIRYTQIDYDREIAIVAIINEGEKPQMIGVTRIIADAYNDQAEFAIVVGDPWHGLGLGSYLIDYILNIARDRGIHQIYAHVLADNTVMLHMLEKKGFTISNKNDECYAVKELTPLH